MEILESFVKLLGRYCTSLSTGNLHYNNVIYERCGWAENSSDRNSQISDCSLGGCRWYNLEKLNLKKKLFIAKQCCVPVSLWYRYGARSKIFSSSNINTILSRFFCLPCRKFFWFSGWASGKIMITLKYFRFWFRFRRDIHI